MKTTDRVRIPDPDQIGLGRGPHALVLLCKDARCRNVKQKHNESMYCIDKCAFIVLLLSYAFLHLTVYCSCSILSHFVSVKTLKSQDRGKTDEESVRPSQCRSGIYKVETSQGRRDSYLAKDIASRHALSRVSFMRSRTSLIDTISFHHTGVGVTTGSDEWLLCVGRMR